MILGFTASQAKERTVTMGTSPSSLAFSLVMKTPAQAPSASFEELAASTVPPSL
jgi:hypothetical protein